MTESELPIDVTRADSWDEVDRMLTATFLETFSEAAHEAERDIYQTARGLLIRDRGEVVAHAAAFDRELGVPGGTLTAAHVTLVAVAPTHRRRGLLSRLMRRQLTDIRQRGQEPVAVLWASEGRIYPRFGYGLAAQRLQIEADTSGGGLRPQPPADAPPGRLTWTRPEAARDVLARVHDQARRQHPGWSGRDQRWWSYLLADPPDRREGQTELRAVLHEGPDGVDGYALWRTKAGWSGHGPAGTVAVQEVVADEPVAYARLWKFLLTIDLARSVSYAHAAMDEPLLHLVAEPRALGATVRDGLWLRLVDVPAALTARRYATPVDVVIEVSDDLLPANAGRWRLTGDAGGARCVPVTDPPELACDVRDLGAVFLGGPSLTTLAAAGRVSVRRPAALPAASRAFGWHRAPVGIEFF